jgi:hypothetical protein
MRRVLVFASCVALATPVSFIAPQGAAASRRPAGDPAILGSWRIVRSAVAPWVRQAKIVNAHRDWIGRTVTFTPQRMTGPGALRCARATYTPTSGPAEGLFQGSLPAPATDAAAALGIVRMPVRGTRLACDGGVFELHRVDDTTLLVALDDVIYTLDRSPGAAAVDTSPTGIVQRLLEHHFATSMAFDTAHMRYHEPWLSQRLRAAIARYFAKPVNPNEAPAIDGDPFTDSQEHPTRFSVQRATVRGDEATVPVRFSDGRRVRTVRYYLLRESAVWAVDDLYYESRKSLSGWLR